MRMATLDELFGDVPLEHEHLERFGYREEKVRNRARYVGRDENGRAVVGPLRHRAKGLLSFGRKNKKTKLPEQGITMKISPININREGLAEMMAQSNRAIAQAAASLRTVDFSKLPPAPPPPQEKPNMFRRLALWCIDKFYDEEWHRGARNTAGTFLIWAFVVFATLVFGKGLLWILSV